MKLADWIGFLCLILALIILWQFRAILLLVLTSVVLAIAINALVRLIQRRLEVKRAIAILLACGLLLLSGILLVSLVVPPFIEQFQELLQVVPKGVENFTTWIDNLIRNPPDWFPDGEIQLPNLSDFTGQIGALLRSVFGNFLTVFSNSVGGVFQLLLVLVLTAMILAEPPAYHRLLVRFFPSFYRPRVVEIFDRCEATLLNWLVGVSLSSLFVAASSALGLIVLGIPFVLAHALLAGLFNFIPNIGPTLSVVSPVSVALLQSPGKAIAVIVLYIIIQNAESYWLGPMLMKKQVAFLPAITLVAQLFFAHFFGPLGLVLALPLAIIAKIWIEEALIKDVLDRWQSRQGHAALETASSRPPMPKPNESTETKTSSISDDE